ncbi:MAG: DUF3775 domain-containing protein [Pseudomonadota bacterium]
MLRLSQDKLDWIIQRAREFDGKDVDTGEDRETDGSDALSVLEERADDTAALELENWIGDMSEGEAAELVALFWIGRGDGDAEDLPQLIEEARAAATAPGALPTAAYLMGSPLLADYLEAAVEQLGTAAESA